MGDIREINPLHRIDSKDYSSIALRKDPLRDNAPKKKRKNPEDEVILCVSEEEVELVAHIQNESPENDDLTHIDISA